MVIFRENLTDLRDESDDLSCPTPLWSCWGPDYNWGAIVDDYGTAVPVVYADEAPAFGGMLIAIRPD